MISVVIPMYNERKIIEETLMRLTSYLDAEFPGDYELVFSDDGSQDGCDAYIAEKEKETAGRVRLCPGKVNHGKGSAVRKGILAAKGDIIVFTDCDLAYGTAYIGDMIRLMQQDEKTDVLVGSRAIHPDGYAGYSAFRRFLSRGYMKFLSVIGGFRGSDSQTGLKGFRAPAAKRIFSLSETDRFAFDLEVLMIAERLGYTVKEMPVKVINNRPSSMSFLKECLRMLRDVMKIRKRVRKIKRENVNPD